MKKKLSASQFRAALRPSDCDAADDTAEAPLPCVARAQAAQEDAPSGIRALAQVHTKGAIDVLRDVMEDSEAAPSARVTAAVAMLDRGWGKATQPAAGDNSTHTLRIETIRRIIVEPGHSDREGVPPVVGTGAL